MKNKKIIHACFTNGRPSWEDGNKRSLEGDGTGGEGSGGVGSVHFQQYREYTLTVAYVQVCRLSGWTVRSGGV